MKKDLVRIYARLKTILKKYENPLVPKFDFIRNEAGYSVIQCG